MSHAPTMIAVVALSAGISTLARADAYSWGGSSGRFEVSVTIGGFNEGAGEGGWDEDSARGFATWAARFNAVIPRGSSVSMVRELDQTTTVTIHRGARVETLTMEGGPDFDAALPLVARAFDAPPPPPGKPARLFTIQLLASRSSERAGVFAAALDRRGVEAEGGFFYQACLPCSVPGAHVLDPHGDALHRVIVGVFDRPDSARRSLARLRTKWKLRGFVREL